MKKLKQLLKQELERAGICTEDAKAWRLGQVITDNRLYISLRKLSAVQGALSGYLGMEANGDEIHGMCLDVQFALVLLTPREYGGYGAEEFVEEIMETLMLLSEHLGVREILCGEAGYDSLRDCFRQEVLVSNQVMAYGTVQDEGVVLEDFRIQPSMR